jgi:hypothetical protein
MRGMDIVFLALGAALGYYAVGHFMVTRRAV